MPSYLPPENTEFLFHYKQLTPDCFFLLQKKITIRQVYWKGVPAWICLRMIPECVKIFRVNNVEKISQNDRPLACAFSILTSAAFILSSMSERFNESISCSVTKRILVLVPAGSSE
jgi:predicted outer membrane lipoprotein